MEMLDLKNGSQEPKPLVIVTMMSLERLFNNNPIVFYELVMKARDHQHEFFGDAESALQDLSLLDATGAVHDSVRNIVLSAVTGEDLEMTLGSPFAPAVPA